MIYNLEKLDRVIDKIIRDLGLGEDDIPYADFIEWIADALHHIGAYPQYIQKEETVVIENYQGLLPCDLDKMIRIKRGCEIKENSGGFYGGTMVDALNKAGVDYESLDPYQRFKDISVPGITRLDNTLGYDSLMTKLNHNGNLIGDPVKNKHTGLDYNINLNKITTSFERGLIEIQYQAFPIDERGWPLVPDDVSYRDALFWKVAYHISMRNPKLLQNQRMQDLEYCRQMWSKYCGQARGNANMPNLAQLERLKAGWLSLYNRLDYESNDYKNLGKNQNLNFQGRY